jgi:branched-chain amino acid aminotransferase
MGTAAVVSPIDGLGYQGEVIPVPAPADGVAMRVKNALADLRYGRTADPKGWMYRL